MTSLYSGGTLAPTVTLDKGKQLMEGLLLNQYQNSPDLQEYYMAFIAEFDFLFETIERVYYGRFIENAVGAQLDVIGIILQQSRAVELPQVYFGFQGAPAVDGFADEATPGGGGIFKSEESEGFTVTPLEDATYRRLLLAVAYATNRDDASIDMAYYIACLLLDRVPKTLAIVTLGVKSVELQLARDEVTTAEVSLILYATKYFVPAGVTFSINQV